MAERILLPSRAYLQERLAYDLETGVLTWRPRPPEHFTTKGHMTAAARAAVWNTRYASKEAGSIRTNGPRTHKYYFRVIGIDDYNYVASRVIWKLVKNEEPDTVDHHDGNSLNNKFANLRACSHMQNTHNSLQNRATKTGVKGVQPVGKRYVANIQQNGTNMYLGRFDTLAEAEAAYNAAALLYFGDFAPQNRPS